MSAEEQNVIIPDEVSFRNKLENIIAGGADIFHVISDFDMTLSKAPPINQDKGGGWSTHGVVSQSSMVSESYRIESANLYNKYRPIEVSNELTLQEKLPHVDTWYEQAHQLLINEKILKKDLQKAVMVSKVQLRNGAKDFLETLQSKNVPILIFSAGIANVIDLVLRDKEQVKIDNELLHIIGNWAEFDAQDKIKSFKLPLVHMFNKNEIQTKGHPYEKLIESHKNVLLIGDGTGDVHMADGMDHDTVLKIGFLNDNVQDLLPVYKKLYDVILTGNQDFSFINERILARL